MNRRQFIKVAGLAFLAPYALANTPQNSWDKILVLLELKGGNDGLNTVVPYTDPKYYELRPKLAIERNSVLQLSETLGLNPVMEQLMPMWDKKELAVVCGVGYEKPNRSHFRSIEIWETGSNSNEFLQNGWVARLFEENNRPETLMADGIILGPDNTGPLAGGNMRNIAMRDPQSFIRRAREIKAMEKKTQESALGHLLKVQSDLHQAANTLEEKLKRLPRLKTRFPNSPIGKQLHTAANLLISKTPTAVIKVSHGGFDTHSNQRNQHNRLLTQLTQALTAFRSAMIQAGLWDKVVVMTYSEFGRRSYQNASQGTDHGTAAPHFILGGKVKGGIYGAQPSLSELKNGDLVYYVDYRCLYNTIAQNWWQMSNIFDKKFKPLDCIKA